MFNNNTDWVNEVKQIGMKHSHYVSLTGGGEKANFRVSGGYDTERGSIIEQKFDRFSTRVNLDYFVSQRIKIISDFSLTYTDNKRNYSNLLGEAYLKMPNMAIYHEDANDQPTGEYYFALRSMPEVLKGKNLSFVTFVDSDNHIWIITDDDKAGTLKGKINRLGFKK
jgi:hypothetical protein